MKHLFVCVVELIDKNKKVVLISYHYFDGEQFLKDIFPGTIFPGDHFSAYPNISIEVLWY